MSQGQVAGEASTAGKEEQTKKRPMEKDATTEQQVTTDVFWKKSLDELRSANLGIKAAKVDSFWRLGKTAIELIRRPRHPNSGTPQQLAKELGFTPGVINVAIAFYNRYNEAALQKLQEQKLGLHDIGVLLEVSDTKERALFQQQLADGKLTAEKLDRLLENRRAKAHRWNREARPDSEVVQRRKLDPPIPLVLTACEDLCELGQCLNDGNKLYKMWIEGTTLTLRVEAMKERAAAVVVLNALKNVLAGEFSVLAKLTTSLTGQAQSPESDIHVSLDNVTTNLWDDIFLTYAVLGDAPPGAAKQKRNLSKAMGLFKKVWQGGLKDLHDLDAGVMRIKKAAGQPSNGDSVPDEVQFTTMLVAMRKTHKALSAALAGVTAPKAEVKTQ
ncbi:MAG: hypothetical protein ABSE73_14215 [Planctomycetota bacterium]